MKRFYIPQLALFLVILSGWNSIVKAQTITFNQTIPSGNTPASVCTAWGNFCTSLLPSYHYTSFSIGGSAGPTIYCTVPSIAQAVATAIYNGSVGNVGTSYSFPDPTDGQTWMVGNSNGCLNASCVPSGYTVEFGNFTTFCNCTPAGSYTSRPGIGTANANWGGITTVSCSPPSQTITINFYAGTNSPTLTGVKTYCSGSTITLTATDPTYTVSPAYNWTGPAGFTATTATITIPNCTVANGGIYLCTATQAGSTSIPTGDTIVVNQSPNPIVGSPLVCIPNTSTFTNSTPGGAWSSSNFAVATVSGGGSVNGLSLGTCTISYTMPTSGCNATITVTVNNAPAALTGGSPAVCTGLSTPAFHDVSLFGTWSTSNPAVGSISAPGVVTGVTPGTLSVLYTIPNGCASSAPVAVNLTPPAISGTPVVCVNSTTSLGNSVSGGTWSSSNNALGTVSPSGAVMGLSAGTPNIIYTLGTGCSASVPVVVNPLPGLYTLIGGGGYCLGGSGAVIGLNGSDAGINYQLFRGTGTMGAAVPGGPGPITIGTETIAGNYTIVANNPLTNCSLQMTGNTNVVVDSLPSIYTITGSGNYCSGTDGPQIGLSGSQTGVKYKLYYGSSLVDSAFGVSGPETFGHWTSVGTYSVVAVSNATACTSVMDGYAIVDTFPLPVAYPVLGGGAYCMGGAGEDISLSYSVSGINYQLWMGGAPVGPVRSGSNMPLDFGTYWNSGAYTIMATNPLTTCTNQMSGSAVITANTLPNIYNLTGTGAYCAGDSGVHIMLIGSDSGYTYSLYQGTTLTGMVTGTGHNLDFGLMTLGGAYHAVATNPATGCTSNMSGNPIVTVNPLPTPYPVTGGGNYCQGTGGVSVMLNGSNTGISYQVAVGGVAMGPVMGGTGGNLTFNGETAAGTYTIIGTNNSTHCFDAMTGSVAVTIDPLPTPYAVTGGGAYCSGGAGYRVGVAYSNTGISYQLYNDNNPYHSPMPGTGYPLDYGVIADTGTYTVIAINNITNCSAQMPGNARITTLALPGVFTLTGGGSYCLGGTGVPFGLSGSAIGINYRLYDGGTLEDTIIGDGIGVNFPLQTSAGSYYVVAVNPVTHCTNNMSGTGSVVVNNPPATHNVTGGGSYCANGAGVNVYLDGSNTGVSYQLEVSGSPTGTPMTGTAGALDFTGQTAAGSYMIMATDNTTHCTSWMNGVATVNINSLPSSYTVTGGGGYCAGATGVAIGLNGSNVAVNYQLNNGMPVGPVVSSAGGAISFGMVTAAGTYSVVATNVSTGCSKTMNGDALVVVNPLPPLHTVTGGGTYCSDGFGVLVALDGSDAGIGYQLLNGSAPVGILWPGSGSLINFGMMGVPGTYTVVGHNMLTNCTSTMLSMATVAVEATFTPGVTVSSGSGTTVCAGTPVTFMASATGGGGSPAYQWYVSGMPVSGAIGSSYNYDPSNGDNVTVMLHSSDACSRPASVMSAPVPMLVNAIETPNISVAANTGNHICNGTDVVFTATPYFGGLTPTYLWKKNGIPVGTDSTYYAVLPVSGDNIFCTMTTSYPCATLPVVYSNQVNMQVDTPQTPAVTIIAVPGNHINMGQSVSFAATVYNTGTNVSYQWSINRAPVSGATASSFTWNNFYDGDNVTCLVTNTDVCGEQSGTATVEMTVRNNLGVNQVSGGNSDFSVIPNPNKGEFEVKGTLGASATDNVTFEVTNVLGQVVYTGTDIAQNGKVDARIQVNNTLANGMYILNISSGDEHTVLHFVIEK